ncbi:hypothetical protein A1O1_03788 [Capronia coronata CBS 617.96]|uniref:Uncharacterized protein n=1 Tax=Capronia coronata CBS 617.96 TaxID=1182541 RepID=W9Z832_9EURO|nr:uncharacterized protein A1O1_03788 [Capronia coronata CBS 617.96]EXJ90684.1 hypothetical protein A1O1_03788 [Capronia coronata CBS 617.96]
MTNPPFYPSEASLLESARQKSRPPNSSCTGAPVEMITPGGEVSFVSRLIDESSRPETKPRIQWFSSMLGKLSSVSAVVDKLKADGCTNFAVAEFVQGQKAKTRRWCVAWSWMGYRPGVRVARGVSTSSGVEKRLLPAPSEYDFEVETGADTETKNVVGRIENKLNQEMTRLDVLWKYLPQRHIGMVVSRHGDVWSRKARRKKLHQEGQQNTSKQTHTRESGNKRTGGVKDFAKNRLEDHDEEVHDSVSQRPSGGVDGASEDEDEDKDDQEEEPALVARISLVAVTVTSTPGTQPQVQSPPAVSNKLTTNIHIRHLQGGDSVLFESFCGWVKRKMTTTT